MKAIQNKHILTRFKEIQKKYKKPLNYIILTKVIVIVLLYTSAYNQFQFILIII